MKKRVLLSGVLLLFMHVSQARHILGGSITYECLGGNQYRFTMKLYKDCLDPSSPDFDRPAYFQIFNVDNNSLYATQTLDPTSERNVVPVSGGCIDNIPDFCTKEATYTFTKLLSPNNNGYIIAYERCCRNSGVINVFNSGNYGTSIFVKLTKDAMTACNNAPVFLKDPPNFVCINSSLNIDFAAGEDDGDKLVYSLCTPYTSGDANNPAPPTSGPITYPPFSQVSYNAGYSAIQPLGSASPITIDSTTGKISGIPKTLGLFTIGVCVKEYRGSILMSETMRDFQVDVQDCAVKEAHPSPPNDPKKASVEINDSTFVVCNGKSVQFSNPGSTNVTYFWNFGDPSTLADTSKIASPVYTYPDTGVYRVKLIIERGKPCADTGYVYVKVYDPVSVKPTFIPACNGSAVLFRDSSVSLYNDIDSWKWKFTKNDSALTKNSSYLYPAAGNYIVSLLVGTAKGCLVQKDTLLTVYSKPKANFTPANLCFKNSTTFTDASTVTSGTITKYNWNFGDGGTDSVKNPSHIFNVFDSFAVQHIVTSGFGCNDTVIKKIKMDDTVQLSYTTAPQTLCEKTTVTFTNTSAGGNATAFQWIINNGPVVSGQTASATFNLSGTFPVKLISTNRCGNDTLNSTIKINANPSINLGTDVLVCSNSTKTITAAGSFDSVRWNTNETTQSITIDGKKSPVIVTVFKGGCAGKDTINTQQQVVTAGFSNNYLCLKTPVTFNNTSTVNSGTLTGYDWDFGDGTKDAIKNPTHVFSSFNNFPIRLIATSDNGCMDTFINTVLMDSILNVDFTTGQLISCERKQVQFIDLTKGGVGNVNTWLINGSSIPGKNANYTFNGAGNYPVKLVVSNRCYSDSVTKNITVRPRPVISLGSDTVLCKNQSTILTVNKNAYDSIRWADGTNAASVSLDGTINPFKIKVYLDGCDAEDTINVTPQKFSLGFSNAFICYKNAVTFNNISTVTPGTISAYNWNFGDGANSTATNPSHSYVVFGPRNITLVGKSNSGCFDTIVKNLSMDDSVKLSVSPIPSDVCAKSSAQYLNQSSGGVNTVYTWSLNNSQPQTDSLANYTFNDTGRQVIRLVAANRCGQDSISFLFYAKPLPQVTLQDTLIMCPGEIRMVTAAGNFDSVFWSNGDTILTTETDGTKSPIVFKGYKNGCYNTDSVSTVAMCDVYIPTAFSPNNDGVNDLFNIMPLHIVSYSMRIFNRWGEMVFETTSASKSWDGNYKGQPCQVDEYIYYVTGIKRDNSSFSLKGIVTLVR